MAAPAPIAAPAAAPVPGPGSRFAAGAVVPSYVYVRLATPPVVRPAAVPRRAPLAILYAIDPGRPWAEQRPQRRVTPPPAADPFDGPVARAPVVAMQTVAIHIPPGNFTALGGTGYWQRALAGRFALTLMNATADRFDAGDEERQAALAVAWQMRDDLATDRAVVIPGPGPADGWGRLYLLAPGAADGGRPGLGIRFVGEVDAADVIDLPPAPSGPGAAGAAGPPPARVWYGGFPGDAAGSSAAALPAGFAAVTAWVASRPPGGFARALTFPDPGGGRHAVYASGVKGGDPDVAGLYYEYLGTAPPRRVAPPAGYAGRQSVDETLERLGRDPAGPTRRRLRHVAGLGPLSASLRGAVKTAIAAYAGEGTVDAQVTVCVPDAGAAAPGARLFTLRFQAAGGDAVDVIADGPYDIPPAPGSPPDLGPLARYYADRLSPTDTAGLRAWWDRRHPANPLPPDAAGGAAADATALCAAAARTLARDLSPRWFADNYGIVLAPPAETAARLQSHGAGPDARRDLKPLDAIDLLLLELVLQRLGAAVVPWLRDVHFIRGGGAAATAGGPGAARLGQSTRREAGKTVSFGMSQTIRIDDFAYASGGVQFAGAPAHAYPPAAHTWAHEIAHACGNQQGIQDAFNRRFLQSPVSRVTWYAASNPDHEAFPEVFAIYYLDPGWLRENHPQAFAWMEHFDRTGFPPALP